ncbi:MAG: hypothetical protein LRZ84_14785 [Desertifilum sp.]|nr:hypothetical protein [Desertifilum sp.]
MMDDEGNETNVDIIVSLIKKGEYMIASSGRNVGITFDYLDLGTCYLGNSFFEEMDDGHEIKSMLEQVLNLDAS